MKKLRERLTYANVVATIALILAVGGGATAIALSLPKNSVKSKQLAPGAVHTSDIAKDAVTGEKVKESTLGKVPSAVHADTASSAGHADSAGSADHAATADTATVANSLNGALSASNLAKTMNVSGQFGASNDLQLNVPGFGSYWLRCHTTEGDIIGFNLSESSSANLIDNGVLVGNESPIETPDVAVIADRPEGASSEYFPFRRRLHVHLDVAVIGSTKTLELDGGGFDAGSSTCIGQLHASISG